MTHFPIINQLSRKGVALIFTVSLLGFTVPPAATEAVPHRAVVTIPNPHSANLLQLRGLGGRGTVQIQDASSCHSLPVRLVAGDFSGESVNFRKNEPIILEVRDATIIDALSKGTDIISEDTYVTNNPLNAKAGILIISGLSADTGFVINPGSSILSDIFGVKVSQISCDEIVAINSKEKQVH
ncbi:MAG: hypothetical protein ABJE63_15675 [Lentilitoribacter sp.]